MHYLPYRFVCTAETQAYRNAVMRCDSDCATSYGANAPEVDWHWIATNQNPYREWIGARIRADSFGYAAPGNMELAADFAWRDARMSHIKNGIYGEMFCAAMIAAAFVYDDPMQIIEAGLAEIPATSRLYAEMRQTIDICRKHHCDPAQFQAVLDDIYALLGHYSCVHTNNNAALVVAALLLGGHDLANVITIAVMGGWDTDCNGATAGSIAGAMIGAKKLPKKWIAPSTTPSTPDPRLPPHRHQRVRQTKRGDCGEDQAVRGTRCVKRRRESSRRHDIRSGHSIAA